MQEQESLKPIPHTHIGQPVPELPVEDVERARAYYRDFLGFELGWAVPIEGSAGNEIASVKRGNALIFFRRRSQLFEPAVHWMYAENVQDTYEEMKARGARITDPLTRKPWGITQFTVEDPDGNVFYVHGD